MPNNTNVFPEYKDTKVYDVGKMPRKQNFLLKLVVIVVSKLSLMFTKYKIEKINMKGLKPPYFLLCNHMYFVDFKINSIATFPYSVNNIVSIDGFYKRSKLMEFLGCISTRKFTKDISLVMQIQHCIKKHRSIVSLYPEARYSPIGTTSILPESIGKLAKLLDVPVVVLKNHGNYLTAPFWNFRNKRKIPLYATMKQILTKEDVEKYDTEKINKIINQEFIYDEYKWQKENKISIKDRGEGLHKVLYQCPHCKVEYKMNSNSNKIWCENCKKEWDLSEFGELKATEGETEFSHIPSWFEWQREQVKEQILNGTYEFEDDVEVYSLKHPKEFLPLGNGKLIHNNKGFRLEGEYNNKKYVINKPPLSMYSLHTEYDYIYFKYTDCIDLSTINDSFYCFTTKPNVLTKLSLAVEELYKININLK